VCSSDLITALHEKTQQHDSSIAHLQSEIAGLANDIARLTSTSIPSPPQKSVVQSVDSRILSEIPEIFTEFQRNRLSLLWRGSRDGFGYIEFHRRCDGHANTLTVISDSNGNIFGGFTPVKWESPFLPSARADDSLKSFLFTLKNPCKVTARKFPLKAEAKDQAIWCRSWHGPCFNGFVVADLCNINNDSYTDDFSDTYMNDTGLYGKTLLTGTRFRIQEIEVFEVTE
jgi:hypothetical protein